MFREVSDLPTNKFDIAWITRPLREIGNVVNMMANNSVWQFPCSLNFCNFRWCPIKSPFPSASDQLDLSRSRSANPCASCSRHGCLTFKMRVWGSSGRSFGSQIK